jgi:ABC-type branched-subunit amino acid transport system substrate-binding protein
VTATTITLGEMASVTGPVPGIEQGAFDGLTAWAAYVNANGGIAGHQVKLTELDDAYDCNTNAADMKKLIGNVFAVVGSYTLADSCSLPVLKANPNLLYLPGLGQDPRMYVLPNFFPPDPSPPGYTTTAFQYIKNKFPNDITHTGQLVLSADVVGGKEFQSTAESIGYKYVYTRLFTEGDTNFTADILRMKSEYKDR